MNRLDVTAIHPTWLREALVGGDSHKCFDDLLALCEIRLPSVAERMARTLVQLLPLDFLLDVDAKLVCAVAQERLRVQWPTLLGEDQVTGFVDDVSVGSKV